MREEKGLTWFNLQNIPEMHLRIILTLIELLVRPEMHLQNLGAFMYFRTVAKKLLGCIKEYSKFIHQYIPMVAVTIKVGSCLLHEVTIFISHFSLQKSCWFNIYWAQYSVWYQKLKHSNNFRQIFFSPLWCDSHLWKPKNALRNFRRCISECTLNLLILRKSNIHPFFAKKWSGDAFANIYGVN